MARLICFNKPFGVLSQFTDKGSVTFKVEVMNFESSSPSESAIANPKSSIFFIRFAPSASRPKPTAYMAMSMYTITSTGVRWSR